MEAATGQRPIEGDKAARIVDAMRASVARRGVAASTFDHVAREAQVSRGLLHYYFGTKERLLAEVVRRDCELRMQVIDDQLAGAGSADDVIDGLVASLKQMVVDDPAPVTLVFELFTLSRRNQEIAVDATIVRLVLVPAAMELPGRFNWWVPAPLRRVPPTRGREEATA